MKILHYIPGYNYGGSIETLFLNYIKEFKKYENFEVTLIVEKKLKEKELEILKKYNINIFIISSPKKFFKYIFQLRKIFNEKYDIIHCHSPERAFFIYFFCGLNKKEKQRIILHAHSVQLESNNKIVYKIRQLLIFYLQKIEFIRIACSKEVAKYFFGNRKTIILKNGIEIQKFIFNEKKRKKIREALDLSNNIIIGHIGRIVPIKNQIFLIDIFHEIFQRNKKAHLLLIGNGNKEYEKKVIMKIKKYNLEENITLLGKKDNVNEILNGIDLIIFPSISEGFGITLIEAQINGLPCFASDTIPKDVKITNNLYFISLKQEPLFWCKEVLNKFLLKSNRKSYEKEARIKGFDIEDISFKLYNIYKELEDNE